MRKNAVALLGALLLASAQLNADMLVVDRDNNTIVVFDDSGVYSRTVTLNAAPSTAADIAEAPNGDVFVNFSNGLVQRYDADLNFLASWPTFSTSYGINVDSSGLVYLAGSGSASVHVYDAAGVEQTTLTPSGGSNLRDTVIVGGNVWISNFTGSKIDILSGGSDVGDIAVTATPFGMQTAPGGDVWLVDQNTHEVSHINSAGTTVFIFDADNGPNGPISDQLRYIGVNQVNGTLYIPRRDEGEIDVYTPTGTYVKTLTAPGMSGPDGILVRASVPVPLNDITALLTLLSMMGAAALYFIAARRRNPAV